MEWLSTKLVVLRRHAVDIFMLVFLVTAIAGAGVLAYLAAQ